MIHSWLFFVFELKRLDVHQLEFVLPFSGLQKLVRSYIPEYEANGAISK